VKICERNGDVFISNAVIPKTAVITLGRTITPLHRYKATLNSRRVK